MLLGWVIRVLVLALILRVVVSFVRGLVSGGTGSGSAGTGAPGPSGESVQLVKDPVCGTYVEPSQALSTRAGSTVHYFCSETCLRTFQN